jgi:hypothetical protein
MEEREHVIDVLKEAMSALKSNNYIHLQALSDQTIHSASIYQHTDYIIIAVLIYALSKLSMRHTFLKIKSWTKLVNKINNALSLAVHSLEKDDHKQFIYYLEQARKTLTNFSVNMKPYIQEVFKKASINKASMIHEHGISLGQTAYLLGLSQWELTEYIGQKNLPEIKYNKTLNIKTRARLALEFFS